MKLPDSIVSSKPKNTSFYFKQLNEQGFAPVLFLVAGLGLLSFLVVTSVAPLREGLLGSIYSKKSSFASTLPTPANLKVEQDDKNAILNWDNYYTNGNTLAAGVAGYVVNWGVLDSGSNTIANPQKKLTEDKIIQLQPLTDGIKYGATVQSVDTLGNVSVTSPLITFQSDSTRVETLRTQMNGFRDSFNVNAGAFDELRWNNAYSFCAGPANVSGQFINNQFHAHNQIYDENCDRGQNVSRPRAVFDFTSGLPRPNGETEFGTITFDMDGSVGRDTWYLDLYDVANGIIDVPARASSSDSPTEPPQAPFNNIRIRASSYIPSVIYVDGQGKLFNMTKTPSAPAINSCCDQYMKTIKNVRNKWVVKVSKSRIIITINGHLAADVSGWTDAAGVNQPLNLSFTKANLLWVGFSYNTHKANMASSLLHWDNFGFDAPTGTTQNTVTHNYTDGNISTINRTGSSCHNVICGKGATTIKVPDSIAGATATRLMFTGAGNGKWTAGDYLLFNGVKYLINDPKTYTQIAPLATGSSIMSGITPLMVIIPITNAKTGDNTLELVSASFPMMNVHLEFDFPKASAPTYTQPVDIWKYNPAPTLTGNGTSQIPNTAGLERIIGKNLAGTAVAFAVWDIASYGPFVLQTKSDGKEPGMANPAATWQSIPSATGTPNTPIAQSGIVGIQFLSAGDSALAGTGSYNGHQSYQLYIDRQKVVDQNTAAVVPAPTVNATYQWDTTKYCNGPHHVHPVTFTPSGLPSFPGYFQLGMIHPGSYKPITIYTNNPGQVACPDSHIYAGIAGSEFMVDKNGYTYNPANFAGGTYSHTNNYETDGAYKKRHLGEVNHNLNNFPNGTYNVTLKFIEPAIWPPVSIGQRVFNVSLNGTTVLPNFDILAQGPANSYIEKTFPVTVTNGTINVALTAVKDQPSISSIAVLPQSTSATPLVFTANSGDVISPTPTTTNSPSVTPVASASKLGDLDGNNKVDIFDFNILLTNFRKTGANVVGDLDKNGKVDIFDYNTLLTNFGR